MTRPTPEPELMEASFPAEVDPDQKRKFLDDLAQAGFIVLEDDGDPDD